MAVIGYFPVKISGTNVDDLVSSGVLGTPEESYSLCSLGLSDGTVLFSFSYETEGLWIKQGLVRKQIATQGWGYNYLYETELGAIISSSNNNANIMLYYNKTSQTTTPITCGSNKAYYFTDILPDVGGYWLRMCYKTSEDSKNYELGWFDEDSKKYRRVMDVSSNIDFVMLTSSGVLLANNSTSQYYVCHITRQTFKIAQFSSVRDSSQLPECLAILGDRYFFTNGDIGIVLNTSNNTITQCSQDLRQYLCDTKDYVWVAAYEDICTINKSTYAITPVVDYLGYRINGQQVNYEPYPFVTCKVDGGYLVMSQRKVSDALRYIDIDSQTISEPLTPELRTGYQSVTASLTRYGNKIIATIDISDQTAYVYDESSKSVETLPGTETYANQKLKPDTGLLVASKDGEISLYDIDSKKEIKKILLEYTHEEFCRMAVIRSYLLIFFEHGIFVFDDSQQLWRICSIPSGSQVSYKVWNKDKWIAVCRHYLKTTSDWREQGFVIDSKTWNVYECDADRLAEYADSNMEVVSA